MRSTPQSTLLRAEWFLPISVATATAFWFFGDRLHAELSNPIRQLLVFVWLFATWCRRWRWCGMPNVSPAG